MSTIPSTLPRDLRKIMGAEAQRQTNQLGNLLKRNLTMSRFRPGRPRSLRFEDNLLKWQPPADDSAVTHYRLRIDTDSGPPDYEVSAGQTSLQLFRGQSFVLSAYNSITRQESVKIGIGAGYGANGNLGVGGGGGTITFSSISAALGAANDFGLRFWIITCNYSSNIVNLRGVAVWVENPAGSAPQRITQSTFIPNSSNAALFAVLPPATTTTLRVYLIPVYDAGEDPLVTVADAGEQGASPHKTVDIGPTPTTDLGIERTSNVLSLAVTKSEIDPSAPPEYYYDAAGVYKARFYVSFQAPADPSWGHAEIVVKKPGPVWRTIGSISIGAGSVFGGRTFDNQEVPAFVEGWRIFARSVDKSNRANSIQESGANITPFVDIQIGDTEGKLDLGKAITTSVGDMMNIVAGVLGVKPLGITQNLIAQFAVSQAKLANAPIIDALRIVDGAITTAKIQAAAIDAALIANAAIQTAHIADLAVTSAKINSLAASKITAGIITANLEVAGTLYLQNTLTVNGTSYFNGNLVGAGVQAQFFSLYAQYIQASGNALVGLTLNVLGHIAVNGTKVVGNRAGAISNPSGGATVDTEARAAIGSILTALRNHGLIG